MTRVRRRLLATVTGAVLAALAVLGTGTGVATAAATSASQPGLLYYGANVHLLWSENTPTDVARQLDLLRDAHANSARVDVAWSSLQIGGRGAVDAGYAGRLDALVTAASARGIALVLTLGTTPCWASTAPESLKQGCSGAYWDRGVTRYAPADTADYAWAAGWVAEHYRGRVAALELWNEPNYTEQGVAPLISPDPAASYAAMVRAAYPAVKRVAPELDVVVGALSFADDDFLRRLYGHGIRGFYDGLSVHPYNEWRAVGAPHDTAWYKYDFVQGLEAVHRTMLAAGDASPVWVTETGWTTCTPGSDRWCVTPAQQASYTADLVASVGRWPWLRALIIYNLRDKGTDPTSTEDNFGLVTRDYQPKPALRALGAAFGALAQAAPVSSPALPPTAVPASPAVPAATAVPAPPAVPAVAAVPVKRGPDAAQVRAGRLLAARVAQARAAARARDAARAAARLRAASTR